MTLMMLDRERALHRTREGTPTRTVPRTTRPITDYCREWKA